MSQFHSQYIGTAANTETMATMNILNAAVVSVKKTLCIVDPCVVLCSKKSAPGGVALFWCYLDM